MLELVREYKKGKTFDYVFDTSRVTEDTCDKDLRSDSYVNSFCVPSKIYKNTHVFATTDNHLIVIDVPEKVIQKEVANPFCTEIVWAFHIPDTDCETIYIFDWPQVIELGNQKILVIVTHIPNRSKESKESECQYKKRLDTKILIGYILDGKSGTVDSTFTHTCFGIVDLMRYGSSHFVIMGQKEGDHLDRRNRPFAKPAIFNNHGTQVGQADVTTAVDIDIPGTDLLLICGNIYRIDPENIETPVWVWGLASLSPPILFHQLHQLNRPSVSFWRSQTDPKIAFFSETPIKNSATIWVFSLHDGKLLFSGSCGNVFINHVIFSSCGNRIFVHHQKCRDQNVYKWTKIEIVDAKDD